MPGDVAQAQAGTGSGAADTTLRIAPLHPLFAARAEGLDLRHPLNAADLPRDAVDPRFYFMTFIRVHS